MRKSICRFLMKLIGWRVTDSTMEREKCILCMAPHTSSLDFIIGWICYSAVGGRPVVMIKREFFRFPFGPLLRAMGATPVNRERGANVISQSISEFNKRDIMHLVITPEGTRELTKRWKSGYHKIAKEAGVPVVLGIMDFKGKHYDITHFHNILDDPKEDIIAIKEWYASQSFEARHSNKFTTEI